MMRVQTFLRYVRVRYKRRTTCRTVKKLQGFKKNIIPLLLTPRKIENSNNSSISAPAEEWIPVELALVDRMWLPDTEILRLKGFHSLSVLGRLQVSTAFEIVPSLTNRL